MSRNNSNRSKKASSDCLSPSGENSNSSRLSELSARYESSSLWPGRIRPSSWDDSDDETASEYKCRYLEKSRIYSGSCEKSQESVSSEIKEIKKQFFTNFQKDIEENPNIENLKSKYVTVDRRQSPARIRRRSKSSSSSSPVLDTKSQLENSQGKDKASPKIRTHPDLKFSQNNYASNPVSKKISLNNDNIYPENQIKNLQDETTDEEETENCKSSRKLSQILEIEEVRKENFGMKVDSEKNQNSDKDFILLGENLHEKVELLPLSTARSRNYQDNYTKQKKSEPENNVLKAFSLEELKGKGKPPKHPAGSVSERCNLFSHNDKDDIIFLTAKCGKTEIGLNSETSWLDDKSFQFPSITNPLTEDEIKAKLDFKEIGVEQSLKTDTDRYSSSLHQSPHKSSQNSGKNSARISDNGLESPIFNLGLDSGRSVNVENMKDEKEEKESVPREQLFKMSSSSSSSSLSRTSVENINLSKNISRSSGKSAASADNSNISRSEQTAVSQNCVISKSLVNGNESNSSSSSLEDVEIFSQLSSPSNSPSHIFTTSGTTKVKNSVRSSVAFNKSIETNQNSSILQRSARSERLSSRKLKAEIDTRSSFSSPRSHNRGTTNTKQSQKISSPVRMGSSQPGSSHHLGKQIHSPIRSPRSLKINLNDLEKKTGRPDPKISRISPRSVHLPLSTSTSSRSSAKSTYRSLPSTTGEFTKKSLENFRLSHLEKKMKEKEKFSSSAKSTYRSHSENSSPKSSFRSSKSDKRDTKNNHAVKVAIKERKKSGKKEDSLIIERYDDETGISVCGRSIFKQSRPESKSSERKKSSKKSLKVDDMEKSELNLSETSSSPDENNIDSHILRQGNESGGRSNRRLSIINEVSLESGNSSNDAILRNGAKSSAKFNQNETSVAPKTENLKKCLDKESNGNNETIEKKGCLGGEQIWSELIETFDGNQKTHIGFPTRRNFNDDNSDQAFYEKIRKKDENSEESFSMLRKAKEAEDKQKSPKRSEDIFLEEKNRFERKNLSLDPKKPVTKSVIVDAVNPFPQRPQMFYFELDNRGTFGIGEFGDVTGWNVGKPKTADIENPKDQGDGAQQSTAWKSLSSKPEPIKRGKEAKNLRLLWTELREDFDSSKPLRAESCIQNSNQKQDIFFSLNNLKPSRSDNSIRVKEEPYDFYTNDRKFFLRSKKDKINKSLVNKSKSTVKTLSKSSESDFDETETDESGRILSSSLSNISQQKKEDSEKSFRKCNSPFFVRKVQEKDDKTEGDEEKQSVDLNIFLTQKKEDKLSVKSNNWLILNTEDKRRKSKSKASKFKNHFNNSKKASSRESEREILFSRRSRSSVSSLKFRNSNCWRNFYKCLISVFCLTSDSSIATSK